MRLVRIPPACVKNPPTYSAGPDPSSNTTEQYAAASSPPGKLTQRVPFQRAIALEDGGVPAKFPPIAYSAGPVPSSNTLMESTAAGNAPFGCENGVQLDPFQR